jgi:hypothetical protein
MIHWTTAFIIFQTLIIIFLSYMLCCLNSICLDKKYEDELKKIVDKSNYKSTSKYLENIVVKHIDEQSDEFR